MEEEWNQISEKDFIEFCETDELGKKIYEEMCKLIHVRQIIDNEDHPVFMLAEEIFEEFTSELFKAIEKKGYVNKC